MTNIASTGHRKYIFIAIAAALLFFPRIGDASQPAGAPDRIHIRLTDAGAKREMPGAGFLHDKHTAALTDQTCSACHLKEKDRFVFKFLRLKDGGFDADKRLYHEKCAGCHEERGKKGLSSGPLTSQCRLCHTQTGDAQSAPRPLSMDKSLHYRHEISTAIPPKTAGEAANCSACHHNYDEKLDKTLYVKGEESACRYCHKAVLVDKTRAFQTVAHESCVNCHQRLHSEKQKTGPTDCAACHDPARLAGIDKIKDVPRIKRNQPDNVLMSLWVKEAQDAGKPSKQFVNPVAFDHKRHEATVEHCYTCHHASLETCGACHTRLGSEKSEFTRLDQAMHSAGTSRSCLGCHAQQLTAKDCAGCHFKMVRSDFSAGDCTKCHATAKNAVDPIPADRDAMTRIAENAVRARADKKRAGSFDRIKTDDIPDEVTIEVLKDQYDGAKFPHRKIVAALDERVKKNELAMHSHDGRASLCNGCHHHSLDAASPPKCAACHGVSAKSEPDGRPGLKGAYHGQCITCHERMGLSKPAATDCTACHQKRTRSAER